MQQPTNNELSILNHQPTSRHTKVRLHNHDFKVTVNGNGSIPCLVMGIGSLYEKTLSNQFLQLFTLYTFDGYWVMNDAEINYDNISITTLCKDILSVAQQLQLNQYILLGHSVFGGLVIEAAKLQDPNLAGVIGIGATPGWNDYIIKFKDAYFAQYASEQRKKKFHQLQQAYAQIKTAEDSLGSFEAYYAESPKYFAHDISRETMAELWDGIHINDKMINHLFQQLLPEYTFSNKIDKVTVPVIVAGGSKDYDSVPLNIWQHYPTPKQFEVLDCGAVGHWPHWEAAYNFDNGIAQWLEKTINLVQNKW